jgi:predicted short-subunit dehydrogenase-like oxidoreductase (DUF2520 family)
MIHRKLSGFFDVGVISFSIFWPGDGTMGIGFIGAGKVATAFGRYLHGCGIPICGYFDRHAEKSRRAADATESRVFPDDAALTSHSDIVLVTTRDDQIAGVCSRLCRQKMIGAHHLVGHMSGAHSSNILADARHLGATIFSLHPLQAFADEDKALAELPHTFFSLEGEGDGLQRIRQLLEQTGNRFFSISSENKSLYHLSACILSNYLVTLMEAGLTALEKSGINPEDGFQAMRPLIEGTLSNILRMGTAKALTGPIIRGDTGTIRRHLQALKSAQLEDIESLYRQMGVHTLKLACRTVLSSADAAALRQLLHDEQPPNIA